LTYQACKDVEGSAGRDGHDDTHGPGRIGLRPRDARHRRQRASAHGQMQKSTAGKFHDARKMALGATISTLQSVLELPRVDFGHGIPCRITSDEDDPSRPSSGPVLQPRLKMLELERMKFTAFSRR